MGEHTVAPFVPGASGATCCRPTCTWYKWGSGQRGGGVHMEHGPGLVKDGYARTRGVLTTGRRTRNVHRRVNPGQRCCSALEYEVNRHVVDSIEGESFAYYQPARPQRARERQGQVQERRPAATTPRSAACAPASSPPRPKKPNSALRKVCPCSSRQRHRGHRLHPRRGPQPAGALHRARSAAAAFATSPVSATRSSAAPTTALPSQNRQKARSRYGTKRPK